MRLSDGSLAVHDDGQCHNWYSGHIGRDMFHGHIAALATARFDNRRAGAKVKRVIFAKGHFMVVTAHNGLKTKEK